MQGVSTVTQKGQVTIPKSIRDSLSLRTSDKVSFETRNNVIILNRLPSVSEMKGMLFRSGQKPIAKKQMKKIIQDAILEKFLKKK